MTIRLGAFATILAALAGTPCVEAAQVYFIHTDLDGSVAMATDLDRNVVYERTYEPYGLPTTPIEDSPGYTGHPDCQKGIAFRITHERVRERRPKIARQKEARRDTMQIRRTHDRGLTSKRQTKRATM